MLALMIFSTIASAAIAFGALLLERAGRMRGHATRWLWVGALLSMLFITIAPLAGVGGHGISSVNSSSSPLKSEEASSGIGTSKERSTTTPASLGLPRVDVATSTNQAPASSHGNAPLNLLLLSLWAIASALCSVVLAGSAWRIARMRREWRPAVVAGVPVLVSHDVGPAIIGLVHHGVVIPAWVEALSPTEQRLVLTHEREHVRAGDPLLLWGATLLAVLLPWNVASWFALRHVRHAIEMDCDARVLRHQTDAHAYCTLLLDVGERTLAGVAPIAALAEPSTLLERRVEAMTARPTPRRHSSALALAGVVMLMLGCVAPRTQIAPQIRARELVRELNALLSSDSIVRSVPTLDRAQLATKLGTGIPNAVREDRTPAREYAISDSERTSRLAQLDEALDEARRTLLQTIAPRKERNRTLDPPVDLVLHLLHPELFTRSDTSAKLVTLIYRAEGTIKASSIRPMPRWKSFTATDFSNVQVQSFELRRRSDIHATIAIVVERGDDMLPHETNLASGGLRPADSENVPPQFQFSRRVDSLARASLPSAFEPRDNAIVVAVWFKRDGTLSMESIKEFPLGTVFDIPPGASAGGRLQMRSSAYLLGLMTAQMHGFPDVLSSGASVTRDAPHAVFLWVQFVE